MNAPVALSTRVRTRNGNGVASLELPFEKAVVVPRGEEQDPTVHAWADARFWADIMSEHAFFFALLMPEEVAGPERREALAFSKSFAALHDKIDHDGAPRRSDLRSFTDTVVEHTKPFIEYKARLGIKSIIDPRLADHVRREAMKFVDELSRAR
jgi:hypothetical protein